MLQSLDPGTPETKDISRHFQTGAWGVENDDAFYQYTLIEKGMIGYLHFGEGKLINHPQDDFSDPIKNTVRSGARLPNGLDRVGVLPIYLVTVAMGLTLFFFTVRLTRTNQMSESEDHTDWPLEGGNSR